MANEIWQQGIDYSRRHHIKSPQIDREYLFHSQGVASFSEQLAQKLNLNADKAYACGLLHDYGKRINERTQDCFHGIRGYYDLMEMGYDEVAKVCLTHTFVNKDFSNADYTYPDHWLNECRRLLAPLTYDDYDIIVQYSDMFFEGTRCITPEERIICISERYKLTSEQKNKLVDDVLSLKRIINEKCHCDTYSYLNIKK